VNQEHAPLRSGPTTITRGQAKPRRAAPAALTLLVLGSASTGCHWLLPFTGGDGAVPARAEAAAPAERAIAVDVANGTKLDGAGPDAPGDALSLDAPRPDAPRPDGAKPDAPKPDAPKPDAPKPDAPKPDGATVKPDLLKPDGSGSVTCISTGVGCSAGSWCPAFSCNVPFHAVWGAGASSVFAVGAGTILHYNGTAWSQQAVVPGTLRAVWGVAATDVYAVGDAGTILHYNGTTWAVQASNTSAELRSVWGRYSGEVYVAGNGVWLSNASGWHSFWNGTEWNALLGLGTSKLFNFGPQQNVVRDLTSSTTTLISGFSTSKLILGAWGVGASLGYAVGESGAVERYAGAWTDLSYGTATLRGVWASAVNDVYIVGDSSTIAHHNGTAWTMQVPPVSATLRGVWSTAGGRVFVVGEDSTGKGIILHRDP